MYIKRQDLLTVFLVAVLGIVFASPVFAIEFNLSDVPPISNNNNLNQQNNGVNIQPSNNAETQQLLKPSDQVRPAQGLTNSQQILPGGNTNQSQSSAKNIIGPTIDVLKIKDKDANNFNDVSSSAKANSGGKAKKLEIKKEGSFLTTKGTSGVRGTVVSKKDQSITMTATVNGVVTTYTIDASKAKFVVKGNKKPTIADITVGDSISAEGLISGTSITASTINDQKEKQVAAGEQSSSQNQTGQPAKKGFWANVAGFFKSIFGF